MTKLEIIKKLIDFAEDEDRIYELLWEHLEVNYCEWFQAGIYVAIRNIMSSDKEIFNDEDFLEFATRASRF